MPPFRSHFLRDVAVLSLLISAPEFAAAVRGFDTLAKASAIPSIDRRTVARAAQGTVDYVFPLEAALREAEKER